MNEAPETSDSNRTLRDVCEDVRVLLAPQVELIQNYTWTGPTENQRLEFVKRAAVVRQFEAAQAVLSLVASGHGATAAIMLRPAYEELLWIEYLNKLGAVALDLVQLLTRKELFDSYEAQKKYLGQREIRDIGFYSRLSRRIEKGIVNPSRELQKLGSSLGWRQGSQQPSMAFIARKVGREAQHSFLYQGTSRAVHFSPHELQRRVWGQHGSVTIASSSFEHYWSDFALSWSFRILIETILLANYTDILIEETKAHGDKMSGFINELRPIQILTAAELEAWDEPYSEFVRKN